MKIGKISAKIHEIGKIRAIFGLGMTPIYGLKNGQIKSLDHNGQSLGGLLAAIGLVISLYYISIYLKLNNVSNSTIIDDDCFAAYCYFWMNLFKSVQCVQESMIINKNYI